MRVLSQPNQNQMGTYVVIIHMERTIKRIGEKSLKNRYLNFSICEYKDKSQAKTTTK